MENYNWCWIICYCMWTFLLIEKEIMKNLIQFKVA